MTFIGNYNALKGHSKHDAEHTNGAQFKGYGSYIVKATFNLQAETIELNTDKAVLIKEEYVWYACEDSPDNLIISFLKTTNMLRCTNLKAFHEIVAPKVPNDQKSSIQTLPGYHSEDYPFFLVAGKSETWIGNSKTGKM